MLCVLDVLRYLELRGVLTDAERQSAPHRLRQSGFTFVPVEPEELKRLAASAQSKPDRTLVESAELRIIRQSLARIRSLDMLQQPGERAFLGRLLQASLWVIRQLWVDEGIPVERASHLTDWLWHHMASSPLDWHEDSGSEAFAPYLSLMLQALVLIQEERRQAFLAWVEGRVLEPLVPANSNVLDHLAELVGRQIEHWIQKVSGDEGTLMAEYLLSRQPRLIGERLKRDEAFRSRTGIGIHSLIGILGGASMLRSELFAAARLVLAQGEDEQLLSLEGKEITVSKQETSIILLSKEEGEPLRIAFEELGVLSSDHEERLRSLDRSLRAIGPTGPDFSVLRLAAAERELSEEEVGELLDALWNGVAGLQARTRAQLMAGKATVWDLVPTSFGYFERFCGPDPGDLAPEEYLVSVLPKYRKALLRRDLGRGLEICLFGALRDDLCPGGWLEEVGDDELWEELEACQPQFEPFSLLGALDIALYRQHDERFRAFAEEAIAKLAAEQFADGEGFDLYQFLPSLAQFVLNRIQLLDNGAWRAPFWKRMCAWMQASMVIRLLADVELDSLREQLGSKIVLSGEYSNLLAKPSASNRRERGVS